MDAESVKNHNGRDIAGFIAIIIVLALGLRACSHTESGMTRAVEPARSATAQAEVAAKAEPPSIKSAIVASSQTLILRNADFSAWISSGAAPAEWTPEPWAKVKVQRTATLHDGKPVIQITPPGGAVGRVYQDLQGVAGPTAVISGSAWLKDDEPKTASLVFYIKAIDSKDHESTHTFKEYYTGRSDWQRVTVNASLAQYDIKRVVEVKFMVWMDQSAKAPIQVADAKIEMVRTENK